MPAYVIDAHLPYYFSLWRGEEYVHVLDLNERWPDTEIWDYTKANNLTIVTKDTIFSDRVLLSEPPPRVIHLKLGKSAYEGVSSNDFFSSGRGLQTEPTIQACSRFPR